MKMTKNTPYLIIGEHSAFYCDGSQNLNLTLKSPQDLSKVKTLFTAVSIDVYTDFPGALYSCPDFPKLSRFELKQALKNHPDLQDKKLIAAVATVTQNKSINLWRLTSTPLLQQWLEALSQHNILIQSLTPLAFQHAFSLEPVPTTVHYWISKTTDDQARHICLIKGVIVFVRYTPLDQSLQSEIKKTLHFIQRDYAVDGSDITTLNIVDQEAPLPNEKSQQSLRWLWLEHLPEKLCLAFKALKKNQQHQRIAIGFKTGTLCALVLSGALFLKNTVSYYQAQSHEKKLLQATKSLPQSIQDLSLNTLENLLFVAENAQTPVVAMATLQAQKDPKFRLEEFHWKALSATQQQLNIAVRHQGTITPKAQAAHIEEMFNTPPKTLPFDQYVDRFEVILTPEIHKEASE